MIQKIEKAIINRILSTLCCWGLYGNNTIIGIPIWRRLSNFTIAGVGNHIEVHSKISKAVKIYVYGNNHHLLVEEGVLFKSGKLWFENEDNEIHIKKKTTIEDADLSVSENGTKLLIGEDCMLSSRIRIQTTDSHSLINLSTGQRINNAASIIIDNHVWVGYNVTINKGVHIGHDAVIAGNSVVTKGIPCNTVAAGIPAKVIKEEITWDRKRL